MFESFKKGLFATPGGIADKGPSTYIDTTRHESLNTMELAQLVLVDLVSRNRIPKDWLQVECFDVDLRPGFKRTCLQLVMQRWSAQLLHYSAALQLQFIAGLDHFEPGIDHSSYVVSWRFSSACVMPSPFIPEGVAWHVSAQL
jgi:hypothetical protein